MFGGCRVLQGKEPRFLGCCESCGEAGGWKLRCVRRRGRWRKSETLELNSDDFLVTLVSIALFHIPN
jgi:hypothetical protein